MFLPNYIYSSTIIQLPKSTKNQTLLTGKQEAAYLFYFFLFSYYISIQFLSLKIYFLQLSSILLGQDNFKLFFSTE